MKKICLSFLFLFAFVHCACAQVYDYMASQYWATYVLPGPNGVPVVRMITKSGSTTLYLDFLANGTYMFGIAEPTSNYTPALNLNVDIQVDRNPVILTSGVTDTNHGSFWFMISMPPGVNFIQQAINGNAVHFRIYLANPVYLHFSLQGFTAAYKHAYRLCQRLFPGFY